MTMFLGIINFYVISADKICDFLNGNDGIITVSEHNFINML